MAESDCSLVTQKVCSSCGISQSIEEFPSRGIDKRRPHRPATRYGRCATCLREAAVRNSKKRKGTKEGAAREARIRREWKERNPLKQKAYEVRSRTGNLLPYRISGKIRKQRLKWIDKGRLTSTAAWKHWLTIAPADWLDSLYMDKPWTDHRLSANKRVTMYQCHRYKTNPQVNAMERVKSQVKKMVKNKSKPTKNLVGYTAEELREHLFSLFTEDMTMEAFLDGQIHIDHIIPKSIFNHLDEEEIKDCWSLSNLRPMWADENFKKKDRACAYEADPVLWMKYGSRIEVGKLEKKADWKS